MKGQNFRMIEVPVSGSGLGFTIGPKVVRIGLEDASLVIPKNEASEIYRQFAEAFSAFKQSGVNPEFMNPGLRDRMIETLQADWRRLTPQLSALNGGM